MIWESKSFVLCDCRAEQHETLRIHLPECATRTVQTSLDQVYKLMTGQLEDISQVTQDMADIWVMN